MGSDFFSVELWSQPEGFVELFLFGGYNLGSEAEIVVQASSIYGYAFWFVARSSNDD